MVPYGFAASSGLVNLTFDSSHLSFAVFIVYQFFVSSLVSWRSKKSSNLKTFLLVQILDVINRFVLGKQLSGKIWGNYWGLKEWPEHSPQTFHNILTKKKQVFKWQFKDYRTQYWSMCQNIFENKWKGVIKYISGTTNTFALKTILFFVCFCNVSIKF
jgi:hypothetical protein